MSRAAAARVLLAALVAAGCQETDRRPAPLASDCSDAARCVDPPPVGAGGSGGGSGGNAPDGGAQVRSVTGSIAWLSGDDFEASQPFASSATVRAEAAGGAFVTASYDGSAFTLPGVLVSPATWFVVEPDIGLDALPTISVLDTRGTGDVSVPLGRPSALDLIFGVLTVPTTIDPERAVVVLRFFNATTFAPEEGVAASVAQAGTIAYAVGGTWSDDALATSPAGLAVIGNIPAVALPGSIHEVVLSGSATGTLDVLLAAGALTLVDVALGP